MSHSHAVAIFTGGGVRRLAALVVASMVLALLVGVGAQRSSAAEDCSAFSDVSSTNVHCANIEWLKEQGITTPDGDAFDPGGVVTRGQMTAFLYRLTHPGKDDPTCTEKPFQDVAVGSVFCGTIAWAKAQGITKGYLDGTFGSSNPTTRASMSAFVFRAANPGKPDPTCTASPYDDVPVSGTFCGTIEWMKDNGITQGVGGGNFGSSESVTRGSMASFVHRAEENTDVREVHANDDDQNTDETPSTGGSSGPSGPSGPATVTGTVTDQDTDSPIADVAVYVILVNGGAAATPVTTATDGTYTVRTGHLVAGDEYHVCFVGSGAAQNYVSTCAADDSSDQLYWNYDEQDPSSYEATWGTTFDMTAGSTTTVSVALTKGGTITGTVTDADVASKELSGIGVYAIPVLDDGTGTDITRTVTDADGSYTLPGLPAGAFKVCFDGSHVGDGTGVGYQGSCVTDKAWDVGDLPSPASGSADVTVTAGGTANASQSLAAQTASPLTAASGSIAGKVTDSNSAGIEGVTVKAIDPALFRVVEGGVAKTATTNSSGDYTLQDVPANNVGGHGYSVCFDASTVSGAAANGGYVNTCYQSSDDTPYDSEPVKVPADEDVTNINQQLASGAAITGTVTSDGAAKIADVPVYAFPVMGDDVATAVAITSTGTDGSYVLAGLLTSMKWDGTSDRTITGYIVCFDGTVVGTDTGYQAGCYADSGRVSWKGGDEYHVPAGATSIPVAVGSSAASGKDVTLSAGSAGIHGTVAAPEGLEVAGSEVELFTGNRASPHLERSLPLAAGGKYMFGDLADGDYFLRVYYYSPLSDSSGSGGVWYGSDAGPTDDWTVPSDAKTVTLSGDGDETADITLPAPAFVGSISGVVSDGTDALPGVNVLAYVLLDSGVATPYSQARTGLNGSYSVTVLAPDTYFMCFESGNVLGSSASGYDDSCLPPGTTRGDLKIGTGNPPSDLLNRYEVTSDNPNVVNVNIALASATGP